MRTVLLLWCLSIGLFANDALQEAMKIGAMNDYDKAIQKAKAEKKIMVMVVVKEHCRWCRKLVDKTLSDPKVQKRLASFVTVIVDRYANYPADFKEDFFTSIFYIDYNTQKSVYENVGYVGTKCFLNDLDTAVKTQETLYGDKNTTDR